MDCLTEPFHKEQKEYYLHTSQWMNVHPQQLLGSPACVKKYDLHKLTLQELQVGIARRFLSCSMLKRQMLKRQSSSHSNAS